MSKKAAFTICAKNYIGLAQVLERSIKKYNDDVDFYIFVVDEFVDSDKLIIGDKSGQPDNIVIAKDVLNFTTEKWKEMSFKYNLTEFCTSIKSMCFSYLFEKKKYEKGIFLDPDILVFNTLDYIYDNLSSYSIILTPHLLNVNSISKKLRDNDMMNTGVFNLGFVALKNNEVSSRMLKWWNERLIDYCYIDYYDGYFTDQKWMDFIPGYFNKGELLVSDHLGMNVAPWNFDERELVVEDDIFYIKDRIDGKVLVPLLFTHYSGFDYSMLILGKIHHTTVRGLQIFNDLLPLFKEYEKVLNEGSFKNYLKMKYSYSQYDNLSPVLNVHRRLYRRLLNDGKINGNPFNTDGQSFYSLLKDNKMVAHESSVIDKSNRFNTSNMEGKIKFINNFFRLFYKILGHQRYFMLLKVLREYSKVENHVHIIDKSYIKNNILTTK